EGGIDVEGIHQLADLQARKGETDAAVATLEDGIKLFPSAGNLHMKLGELEYGQRKDAQAKTELTTALKTEGPHQARAHYLLGFVLYRSGDTPGALKEFSEAARVDPKMAEAFYHM